MMKLTFSKAPKTSLDTKLAKLIWKQAYQLHVDFNIYSTTELTA